MTDGDMSDIGSDVSDLSYISDLDDEHQSVNYDLSNGSPINSNNFYSLQY